MAENKSKVMVVDDELFFREFITESLSEEYDVIALDSGKKALDRVKKEAPDIILLDRVMSDMSGEEVCKVLKNDESTMTIPIIMVTALGQKEDLIEGLDAGADYYVAKPVYIPELRAKIRSSLRTKNIYINFEKKDLLNVLDIYESLTTFQSSGDILIETANKVAVALDAVRCSIVKIEKDDNCGYIIASNEEKKTKGLKIDLDKYPEIRRSIDLKRDIIIEDIATNPIMASCFENVKDLPFSSLAVIPLSIGDKFLGTLLLRVATEKNKISEKEISFCEVVARAAANVLENAKLLESLRLANLELEKLATTDGLTEIYNHRYFYNRLEEEYNIAQRYNVSLACIMLDIDFFKKVNDTYGHRQGDIILKELANVIKRTIRKTDIVARYGGEEFVVLLPHTDEAGVRLQAERMGEAVRSYNFPGIPEDKNLTISLGIANLGSGEVTAADDLVKFADIALYEAKNAGRNRAIFYDDLKR